MKLFVVAFLFLHTALAVSPLKGSKFYRPRRVNCCRRSYSVAAFHELQPHEANIFIGIRYAAINSFNGVIKLAGNLGTSVKLRSKRRQGEALSYSQLDMMQQSTKDLKTLLVTSFLVTRPFFSTLTFFAMTYWPMAVFPSTFEGAWEKRLRNEKRCRRIAHAPVNLLSRLEDAEYVKNRALREQYDEYTQVAKQVLQTKNHKELLSLLDQYLVPSNAKSAKKNVGALPWQFVKSAHEAVGECPNWFPAWLTRGSLIDHLKNIEKADAILVQNDFLTSLSREELESFALDRGMVSTASDAKLRANIGEWLELTQADESRDPLRTRLALIAANSMDAARATPLAELFH